MTRPFFSIVTPTYNRASLIHRVFSSLQMQTFNDFEWIVIDDGSTDNTELVISDMIKKSGFPIKYIKTSNQGKANALNESLSHCCGILYLVFDSDDWCDSDALECFYSEFEKLKTKNDFEDYCALSSLKRLTSGKIVGDTYNNINKYGSTYIDRINLKIKGDKWECLIFDKMKTSHYPTYTNEKYMAPGYIWIHLAAQNLKTVFINKPLSTVEYQHDGISRNNLKLRIESINNTILYYKKAYKVENFSYLSSGRYYTNFVRFSLHGKRNPTLSIYYIHYYILGILLYIKDNFNSSKVK